MRGDVLHVTPVDPEDGRPSKALLVLHGIYGRGRNWMTLARALVSRRPEWGARLVDLRLHGASPRFEPPHTLAAAARDVERLIDDWRNRAGTRTEGAPLPVRAVLGHSFGGKVALSLAMPLTGLAEQVWVIDSTPDARAPDGSAWRLLDVARRLPARFASRDEAVAGLQRGGYSLGVARWMASNLEARDGGYAWAIDLDAMESLLRDFFQTDLWSIVETPPAGMDLHVVKAEESSILTEAACERIARAGRATGRVHLHRIAGGHWLHTENPRALLDLLAQLLP